MKKLKTFIALAVIMMIVPQFGGCFGGNKKAKDPTVSSIEITSTTHKTVYRQGDTLDLSNLTIAAKFSNDTTTTPTVIAAMVSGFVGTELDELQTITITYEDKTADYDVIVISDASYDALVRERHDELFFPGFSANIAAAHGINNGAAFEGFTAHFNPLFYDAVFNPALDAKFEMLHNAAFNPIFDEVFSTRLALHRNNAINEELDTHYEAIYQAEIINAKTAELMQAHAEYENELWTTYNETIGEKVAAWYAIEAEALNQALENGDIDVEEHTAGFALIGESGASRQAFIQSELAKVEAAIAESAAAISTAAEQAWQTELAKIFENCTGLCFTSGYLETWFEKEFKRLYDIEYDAITNDALITDKQAAYDLLDAVNPDGTPASAERANIEAQANENLDAFRAVGEADIRTQYDFGGTKWEEIYTETMNDEFIISERARIYAEIMEELESHRQDIYGEVMLELVDDFNRIYDEEFEKFETLRTEIIESVKTELNAQNAAQLCAMIKAL